MAILLLMVGSMSKPGKSAAVWVQHRGPRVRYLFLLGVATATVILLLSLHSGFNLLILPRDLLPTNDKLPVAFQVDNPYAINTEGCTIPGLKPFDVDIKRYVTAPEVDPCRNYNFTLVENNDTHIWIQKEYARYLGVEENNITCCYKPFYRPDYVDNVFSTHVDDRIQYKSCIFFNEYIEVTNEFVKVLCEYKLPNNEIGTFEQFFLFPRKKSLTRRILIEDVKPQSEPSYNVVMMGFDAMSRLNFHRTMPKTMEYLRKKDAIELMGYNKVGDNTFPNLIPLLLGIRETELPKTCWPHAKSNFDNCPFVWEWFKQINYYTALGEDNAKLGTFNYRRPGFIGTPTDYYLYPFMVEAEHNNGNNKDFNCFLCAGSKYFYQVLLDYVEGLTRLLQSSRLFGFFWEATMSHDHLNYPMVMDNSYTQFLKKLDSFRYLDQTIMIFLSDHGIRWGDIRYTKQGRLEERLPFVYILVPPSFRENYSTAYENLRVNSRRLTTPFDLHATLVDLVDMESVRNENIKRRSEESYAQNRSISLFLPVPTNRTCKMADIDDHWCTCHKRQKTLPESEEAREVAAYLLQHLNALVQGYSQCAPLKLDRVIEVTELMAGQPDKNEKGWREYLVVVRVVPGGGLFEATLRRDARSITLAGPISRLNLYGEQSTCIHHYRLKLYCFCIP